VAAQIIRIASKPGCKRDGTRFESDYYSDVQWCRFQRGLPRKIAGYQSVAQNLPELVYGLHSFSANSMQYFHLGSANELVQRVINSLGALTASNDRTPAGLAVSPNNIWQFDAIFNTPSADTVLVAHAAPNMDISSTTDTDIYYGVITAAGLLVATAQDPVSGGVLTVGNYLVSFGSGGLVQWSAENDVTTAVGVGTANVTQQKIITGKRIRGGGVPSALLWSLDSLLQMTFAGVDAGPPATAEWDFDTITDETSILSSRGVIEYDGVFYWPGVDRFLAYNGVVREVPNNLNINYFFDNLNFAYRQKVFAYKVPRFGEIWWCYPRGSATECTHAVIFNVREQTWYDTELPNAGRTDGLYAKVYFKPFMTGAETNGGSYDLWQHETGVNNVRLGVADPIPSHFETHEISVVGSDQAPDNKALRVEVVETDFVQAGDMTVTVRGRANARSTIYNSAAFTIPAVAADSDEQIVRLKENRRLMSFKFESNELDGTYQMGEILGHVEKTDARMTQ
jgi:hypothetical protein